MSVTLVGHTIVTDFGANITTQTEIAIPAGSREGDLLILTMLGGSLLRKEGDIDSAALSADPRLSALVLGFLGNEASGLAHRNIYHGRVTEDLSPIQIQLRANSSGSGIQFLSATATLGAFRAYGAAGVSLDLGRSASVEWEESPDISTGQPGFPALPGSGDAALAIYVSANGLGGTNQDWSQVNPPWRKVADPGSYWRTGYLLTDEPVVPSSGNPNLKSYAFQTYLFGLTVDGLVVTRQHPRDDGRGLSAGPRLYPPPKSQRIVGGYQ